MDFDPGANDFVLCPCGAARREDPGRRRFTTLGGGGTGTTSRSHIGRLHADGTVEADFDPGPRGTDGPSPFTPFGLRALALQPDGKILVGGYFTYFAGHGGTGTTPRNHIARLLPDGSLDADFDPGANGGVFSLAVQPDGKILVGGAFTTLGGGGTGTTPRSYLARLHPDGSLDTTFNPGADNIVQALALQPDGKILVGGSFTMLGGGGIGTTIRNRLGRLHADGSLDADFNPGANVGVNAVALQSDGKILVGGAFTTLGGGGTGTSTRNRIGRLHADGTLDATFNPGANDTVNVFAVQSDGQILVGGFFTGLGGELGSTLRFKIGRLRQDGSLDADFNPGANATVFALAIAPDGQILVGGVFTMLGGGSNGTTPRHRIGRLHADGSLDSAFNPGANDVVLAVAVQPDAKPLVGGLFTTLGGGGTGTTPRNWIGRLTTTDAAIQRLSVSCPGCVPSIAGAVQSQVTWARSGAGPEVERVTFEASSDGMTYAPAGSATRVAGGWQATLTGVSNANWLVRARGYYTTGIENASGSIVESIRQVYLACPTIAPTSLPAGNAGVPYTATLTAPGALGVVTFSVTGALPAGLILSSGGTLSGTPTQAGTFLLTVTATDQSSGCSGSQAVTLPISPTGPLMTLDKTSLRFGAVTTGTTFVSQTASQVVRLTQSGAGSVTWTATPSQAWLQVSPASGSGSADLSISVVSVPGLPVGSSVAGAITLTVTGASNAPGPIAVTLDLILNGLSTTPIGAVDTPLENTTGVTGAIPFTGWALDDVERDARDGVPGGGQRGSGAARSELRRCGADLPGVRGVHRRGTAGRGHVLLDLSDEHARGLGLHGADEHAAQPGERDVSVRHVCGGPRRAHDAARHADDDVRECERDETVRGDRYADAGWRGVGGRLSGVRLGAVAGGARGSAGRGHGDRPGQRRDGGEPRGLGGAARPDARRSRGIRGSTRRSASTP